jgi:hypothetical protein
MQAENYKTGYKEKINITQTCIQSHWFTCYYLSSGISVCEDALVHSSIRGSEIGDTEEGGKAICTI